MAKLQIGVLVTHDRPIEHKIAQVAEFGLKSCQFCSWDATTWEADFAEEIRAALDKHDVRLSTFWSGYSGPIVWNFIDGPATIGLVPPEYREDRVRQLKKGADFAVMLGAQSITTHVGFIPEDPQDPKFAGTVEALKQVAGHCLEKGIGFWFETGQETPVTLLRTIEAVGLPNLGINCDTANLILYGKANPVDALDVFGKYVREVHAKDGFYPTTGADLGKEAPLGDGKVNFPAFVPKLKSFGFEGVLTIEREISGPQQIADIRRAIEILEPLC